MKKIKITENRIGKRINHDILFIRTTVLQGGWPLFLHRMGVVLMNNNKNQFDFKDLMAFGMFILSLLTFIYMICH